MYHNSFTSLLSQFGSILHDDDHDCDYNDFDYDDCDYDDCDYNDCDDYKHNNINVITCTMPECPPTCACTAACRAGNVSLMPRVTAAKEL